MIPKAPPEIQVIDDDAVAQFFGRVPAKKEVIMQDVLEMYDPPYLLSKLAAMYEDRPNAHLFFGYNNYYDECKCYIQWSRPETDEEFAARRAKEKTARIKREMKADAEKLKAYNQYQRLKAKYGFE